jgi:Predicted acyl esterases
MGDAWMGDDFFHQGAFRLSYGLEYSWMMEASSNGSVLPSPNRFDMYDWYGSFPTLDSLTNAVGAKQWPTWRRFLAHPAYDSAWASASVPRFLTHTDVPMLTVGGWWDQEDMYGPQATYRSLEKNDASGRNFIALGPWYHGEWFEEAGDSLGNVHFGSPTGEYYRRNIEAPWFAYWLKGKGDGHFPEARVFDAGSGSWLSFDSWPPKAAQRRSLYFGANGRLSFDAPVAATGSDIFISDPAHPVPYRPRPVEVTYSPGSRWSRWMTEDQRFVDGRPDVLTWQTGPLSSDISIAGEISAQLFASTTGSDADWVVKLIDVFPDTVPGRTWMGGYELMVAGDIMRGRYRNSFAKPEPIPANVAQPFTVDLHGQAYTFKKGHRIMVQLQSSWFPLYDRNPQTFVPNIFAAIASDYHSATHRIFRDRLHASRVDIPVIHCDACVSERTP